MSAPAKAARTSPAAAAPGARRRGPATREAILTQALHLFARKGYEATSVRDLSQAVGVSDAALYRHFAAKDDIAAELFQTHFGNFARSIRKIGAASANIHELVHLLADLLCTLHDDTPDVFRFILLHQHEHLRFVHDESNAVAALVALMATAHARGEIVIEEAELAAAIALGSAIQPAVFQIYGRLPGPLRTRQQTIEAAILRSLGAAPAADSATDST